MNIHPPSIPIDNRTHRELLIFLYSIADIISFDIDKNAWNDYHIDVNHQTRLLTHLFLNTYFGENFLYVSWNIDFNTDVGIIYSIGINNVRRRISATSKIIGGPYLHLY